MSEATASKTSVLQIFLGPRGIRAGWRFVIFVAIVVALRSLVSLLAGGQSPIPSLEPGALILSKGRSFIVLAAAAAAMSKIEKQPWGSYGLPLGRAPSLDSLVGLLWGFGSLSLLMMMLHLANCYRVQGLALGAIAAVKFGLAWAVAFLVLALLEEFSFRGYAQRTLASGMGFWPAATLLSLVFVLAHVGNAGENWLGLADVFLIGMFYSFTLWRTGDLWCAVAMHASWDWGLSYFYSVPDSGMPASGHLFDVYLGGPPWLSGGAAGPEGSVISFLIHLAAFPAFFVYTRGRQLGTAREPSAGSAPFTPP
jgi:membrane protease YdiL (CAAX protease family)